MSATINQMRSIVLVGVSVGQHGTAQHRRNEVVSLEKTQSRVIMGSGQDIGTATHYLDSQELHCNTRALLDEAITMLVSIIQRHLRPKMILIKHGGL